MRGIVLLGVIGLGLSAISRANADAGPMPVLPPTKESVTLKIEVDATAKGPRVVLGSGAFTPEPPPRGPRQPRGALGQDGANGIAVNDNPSKPGNHIAIAGVAFAMSMAFGGLWLFRKNGKGSMRSLTLLIAAGATLAAGAVVWAAKPPTADAYPIAFEGKAGVEYVYSNQIRLILDKESYEKLKKGELKEVPAKTK